MTLPPLTALRRFDTHRLLPAKYSTNLDSVLTRLLGPNSAPDDLANIFELDNATNARLLAEDGRSIDITARELVSHVPQAHIINAAFTHPNPLGARFSSAERGAWYASFEFATSRSEVLFHKEIEYAEINWKQREEILYDDYLADFTGPFHDLRPDALRLLLSADEVVLEQQRILAQQLTTQNEPEEIPYSMAAAVKVPLLAQALAPALDRFETALSPSSYLASQSLAMDLLQAGSLGIIYPSVRRAGGTCIACFRPSVVSNVRKGDRYRLTWSPGKATFERCRY